jgi:hypothetical protein
MLQIRTQVFLLLGLVGGYGCRDCNESVSKGLKRVSNGVNMEFTKLRAMIVSHHLTPYFRTIQKLWIYINNLWS